MPTPIPVPKFWQGLPFSSCFHYTYYTVLILRFLLIHANVMVGGDSICFTQVLPQGGFSFPRPFKRQGSVALLTITPCLPLT
jgi:hypothetical protein